MTVTKEKTTLVVHMAERHPRHYKALRAIFGMIPGEFSGGTSNTVVVPGDKKAGRFHEIAEALLASMAGEEAVARLQGIPLTQLEIYVEKDRAGEFVDRLMGDDDIREVLLETPEFESINSTAIVQALAASAGMRP